MVINPPYTTYFGGIFEIMIKSAKRAIMVILSNADVKDEELMTAFCGAEAMVNSRSLMYQSADIKDNVYISYTKPLLTWSNGRTFCPRTTDEIDFELRDMLAMSTRISKTFLASMIQRMDSKFYYIV